MHILVFSSWYLYLIFCIFFKCYKSITSINTDFYSTSFIFLCHLVIICLLSCKFQHHAFLQRLPQIVYFCCYCLFWSKFGVDSKVQILWHSLLFFFMIFLYIVQRLMLFLGGFHWWPQFLAVNIHIFLKFWTRLEPCKSLSIDIIIFCFVFACLYFQNKPFSLYNLEINLVLLNWLQGCH